MNIQSIGLTFRGISPYDAQAHSDVADEAVTDKYGYANLPPTIADHLSESTDTFEKRPAEVPDVVGEIEKYPEYIGPAIPGISECIGGTGSIGNKKSQDFKTRFLAFWLAVLCAFVSMCPTTKENADWIRRQTGTIFRPPYFAERGEDEPDPYTPPPIAPDNSDTDDDERHITDDTKDVTGDTKDVTDDTKDDKKDTTRESEKRPNITPAKPDDIDDGGSGSTLPDPSTRKTDDNTGDHSGRRIIQDDDDFGGDVGKADGIQESGDDTGKTDDDSDIKVIQDGDSDSGSEVSDSDSGSEVSDSEEDAEKVQEEAAKKAQEEAAQKAAEEAAKKAQEEAAKQAAEEAAKKAQEETRPKIIVDEDDF